VWFHERKIEEKGHIFRLVTCGFAMAINTHRDFHNEQHTNDSYS